MTRALFAVAMLSMAGCAPTPATAPTPTPSPASPAQAKPPSTPATAPARDWLDPTREVGEANGLQVVIRNVAIEEPTAKWPDGRTSRSGTRLLLVRIELHNKSLTLIHHYSSWRPRNLGILNRLVETQDAATLADNFGNPYEVMPRDDRMDFVGSTSNEEIRPGVVVNELLAFTLPIDRAEYLTLTLPRGALRRGKEDIRFRIPTVLIRRAAK